MARAVDLEHGPFGRTVLQNSVNNLKPPIIAESGENECRVASAVHVLTSQPGFKLWKHTLVMKVDNLLGDLKLFPEHRRALELLNKVGDGLKESCGQKTDASQQGSAHEATRVP